MLYREIMAVCSEIHTKHSNTLHVLVMPFIVLVFPLNGRREGRTALNYIHCVAL